MDRSAVQILLLDDEPFILKLHAHMLAELGFVSSRTFETGALALAGLDRGPAPDLIFLDLSMPEMDGIQFIRHLVKRGYAGSLVLVSGEDERVLHTAKRLVQAHGIAVLGHVSKPVTPAQLAALLEVWERPSETLRGPEKIYAKDELLNAIRDREIVNYYQPKVSPMTGDIVGVESLARWQHPKDGLVLPGQFIGVAERHGLIEELTRTTFRGALNDNRALELGGFPLQVAINLSAQTLASVEFADFVIAEASRASVLPENIVLEVTETQVIRDLRAPLEVLARLHLLRFTLSIDDFGTGYSSLSQLRNIPFDELKIDQSFVHRASSNPTARAIFDASLGLARQLGMKAVAEGVENRADWDLVRDAGCDAAQGFFIARPMPADALPAWREAWRERARTEFVFS